MRKIDQNVIANTMNTFQTRKIMTIEQISSLMNCSFTSVRRYLNVWNAYTSYNKKGRFYTIPGIPQFDHHGLWWFQNIFFTQHRNLKNTIIFLVKRSQKGMSSREIGNIVGLDPSSFMHHFRDIDGIKREKMKKKFIYFSDIPELYNQQRYHLIEEQRLQLECPSESDTIHILVQFIKNPGISVEKLSSLIASQGNDIEPSVIRRLLEYHDLLKKTQDTEQSPV